MTVSARHLALSTLAIAALFTLGACGDKSTNLTGDGGTACMLGAAGATCAGPEECCSNACVGGVCDAVVSCTATQGACTLGEECCSGRCDAGACVASACVDIGGGCADGGDCCSGRCDGGTCLPAGTCLGPTEACTAGPTNECCSGRCEPVTGMAGVTQCTDFCRGNGASCTRATDCCDLNCNNGTCGGEVCLVQSSDCTSNAECCSNICTAGKCQLDPANTTCRGVGETCNSGSQAGCCSMVCDDTVNPPRCDFGADVCKAQNASCTLDAECCNGNCDPGTGLCTTVCVPTGVGCATNADCCSSVCTAGACAPPPMCEPIGTACATNGDCCSGLCLGGFCDLIIF